MSADLTLEERLLRQALAMLNGENLSAWCEDHDRVVTQAIRSELCALQMPDTFDSWRKTQTWYTVCEPGEGADSAMFRLLNIAASSSWQAALDFARRHPAQGDEALARTAFAEWVEMAERLARVAVLSEATCSLAWVEDPSGERDETKQKEQRARDAFDDLMRHIRTRSGSAP